MRCDPTSNGFHLTASYVLDEDGSELTQQDGSGNWQRTNVYVAGKLLATYDPNGLHFHLTDPLGTRRMQVSGNLNTFAVPDTDIQSLPSGDYLSSYPDPYAPPTADDATPLHFTGKERDAESGNDYFGARYMASSMGRWLSPDVVNVTEERMLNPANTLNKYAYGANNPLKYVDPDGQDIVLFFENGVPGHIMMMAYDPSLPRAAYRSFGPTSTYSAAGSGLGSVPTTIGIPVPATNRFDFDNSGLKMKTADDIRKNFASITIKTSPEVTQQVVQALLAHSNDKWYATFGGACASTCARILHQIAQFQNLGTNNLLTPYQFFNQAYQEYGNGKAAVPWGDGTTNVFKAGTNYGSYQPGWNEFDMLNLLVHQPCAQTGAYDSLGNSTGMSGCQ